MSRVSTCDIMKWLVFLDVTCDKMKWLVPLACSTTSCLGWRGGGGGGEGWGMGGGAIVISDSI